jgi:O-antigen ligase
MTLVALKLLLAVLLPVWFVRYYRWYLLWIPLFEVPGIYWVTTRSVPHEYTFVQAYIELLLGLGLLLRWLHGRKDMVSVMVLGVGIAAVPALANAGGHFFFSLFLVLCVVCGAGVYQLFADHMEWMLKRRVVDLSILLWVALGIFTKFYDAAITHQSVLYQRGGGIYGSNHVGGILILLLPFASSGMVMVIGYLFLLLNFSRGIWLALGVLVLLWGCNVSARQALKAAAAVALVLVFALVIVGRDFRQLVVDFGRERYEGMTIDVMGQNDRWEIYNSAMEMGKKTSFVGVGLGGFAWGLSDVLNQQPNYSNAHNLYLTSLAEGGILFTLFLIAFLGFLTLWAFYVDRRAFCTLVAWIFYGFFSGEIYEAANVATAGDYYCLLFVAAVLMYKTKQEFREQRTSDNLFSNQSLATT